MSKPLIIANCSGFYGDRLSAAAEMVRGGPIDVLTGDYLAELTLAILFRNRMKNPNAGYAATFLKQMDEVMAECLTKKIRVVVNAGGLNPRGMAAELERLAAKLGLKPNIAFIEGDDLLPRLDDLQKAGEAFTHIDKGIPLSASKAQTVTANAYLGGFGIAAALAEGADIVVAPRVTDAALVVGPAAWKFGWGRDAWDQLASAVAAGHIIECGPQACGGNYAFFEEVPSFHNMGFPIAEIHADGSFVITKHPGTGGIVNVGTVTAQLLYEIRGRRYPNPDVTALFDTAILFQEGADRVHVSGVKGEAPPSTTKVSINQVGGFRNAMSVYIAGMDIEKKAAILERQLRDSFDGAIQSVEMDLRRTDKPNPATNDEAYATLHVAVYDENADKVGKRFSAKVVELALSTIPGFKLTSPPGEATPSVTFWPGTVSAKQIRQSVYVSGKQIEVESVAGIQPAAAGDFPPAGDFPLAGDFARPRSVSEGVSLHRSSDSKSAVTYGSLPETATLEVPLGVLFGARSGDKGGSANLGVWAKTKESYEFLQSYLTADRLKELLPDLASFPIERHDFPNLKAVNFYINGLLGDGAISSTRFDPQAKTLGEYFRARVARVPKALVLGVNP